jgi:putative tricarboxylic transport membrane protein
MENFAAMAHGFTTALTPVNVFYLFIGVVFGNIVGVLPGIGPISATVLLIPITFTLEPETAIIMLAGVYYGSMYGGSTTSILLNIPGEAASVMTAVEGYPLAKQGRAGAALGMSAISSFVAGTFAVVGLNLLAVPMANLALSFGPPEEFSLVLAAFTLIAAVGGQSVLKGLAMGALGVVLATIGLEPMAAQTRLSFGIEPLQGGISFVAAAIGLFAIPEVLESIERPEQNVYEKTELKLRNLIPTLQDFKDSALAFPVATVIGFFGGLIPGAGAVEGSFLAYGIQKQVSPHPERFGKGAIDGVCAVEGANNAGATAALVPMLTLGIPGSSTAAILMGAMMIHGLRPGPLLFQNNPDFVWGLVASMYLGNIMLLILNLPLIGIWISMMRLPTNIVLTAVLALSVAGAYAEENSLENVWIMLAFGVVGYIFKKLQFPFPSIVLALVLTGTMEGALHRSLAISGGDWLIFITRPISLTFLIIGLVSVLAQLSSVRQLLGRSARGVLHQA